jgi:hypothetical protein
MALYIPHFSPVIHAIFCPLSPDMSKKAGRSFFGYESVFFFVSDQSTLSLEKYHAGLLSLPIHHLYRARGDFFLTITCC